MAVKIAIVGGADSRKLAPFEDRTWEIWGCNNCYRGFPRFNRWFELHKIGFDGKDYYRRGKNEFRGMMVREYLEELAGLRAPTYMQLHWPIIPHSIQYPLMDIVKRFGRYFTSSISYMVALAIREGATDIALFGINMGLDDEYSIQKPSIEYLLGYAKGLGIRVSVTEDSMLLFIPQMYGFEEIILPDKEEILRMAR